MQTTRSAAFHLYVYKTAIRQSLRLVRAAAQGISGMEAAVWEPKKVGYKVRTASTSKNLQVIR